MTIQIYDDSIYFIRFKNIKLAIDFDTCVFLGEIKDGRIELNLNTKRFLLKKFKISQFYSFTKNLVHIKFLAKYSPIFSKFIDDEELDKIELEELQKISYGPYYLKFNENTKFLNAGFMMRSQNAISICVDSKLMKMLEEENGVESIWMIKIEDL